MLIDLVFITKLSKQQVNNTYFEQYANNKLDEDLNFFLDNSKCIKEDNSKLSFLHMHRYFYEIENDGTLDGNFTLTIVYFPSITINLQFRNFIINSVPEKYTSPRLLPT